MRKFTYSTRLNSFKARPELYAWKKGPGDITDLIARAATVPGLDSIELNYPEHFVTCTPQQAASFVTGTHLRISGINLRYPDAAFRDGIFTNPSAERRAQAVELTKKAVDVAAEMGSSHVVVWLAQDGFDYPMQMDYARAWEWEVAGIRAVADHRPEMAVSIEYKPVDPRRASLVPNLGLTLAALDECRRPNLGVTVDFCHALMAQERPAMAVALALHRGLLQGVHLNDGYGQLDDGLMVGSVHLPETLELIYYLLKFEYNRVVYFDTFPLREDPVAECARNIRTVNAMVEVLERVDEAALRDAFQRQDSLPVARLLWEAAKGS